MSSPYENERAAYIAGIRDAEAALKAYEHAGAETVVPCINELRYAAKHVADALLAEGNGDAPEIVREHWNRAVRHTRRAQYDVLEFHVELVKLKVAEAIESYTGYAQIAARVIPNYFKHKSALYALSKNLREISDCTKDTEAYRACCERHIAVADAFMQDFLLAEQELMLSIEQEKMLQEEKNADRRIAWKQCIVSVVLTSLVAFLIFLLSR